jgi:hypothetical protein
MLKEKVKRSKEKEIKVKGPSSKEKVKRTRKKIQGKREHVKR